MKIKSITTMRPVWNSSATFFGPEWVMHRGSGEVFVFTDVDAANANMPSISIPLSNIAEIVYDIEAMAQDREVSADAVTQGDPMLVSDVDRGRGIVTFDTEVRTNARDLQDAVQDNIDANATAPVKQKRRRKRSKR